METNALISRVVQLYNQAATSRDQRNPGEARAYLEQLRDMLNKELPVEAPAAPDSPDQAGRT